MSGLGILGAVGWLRANPIALYVLAGLAVGGAIYMLGRSDGAEKVEKAQLEAALEASRVRSETNAASARLSDVELCMRLGGLRDDCLQLRRPGPAAPAE